LGLGGPDPGRVTEIMQDVAAGRVRALVVVGEDPLGEGLLEEELLGGLEALVVFDRWSTRTVEAAHVALPICGYGEHDGVHVNFGGHAQRARQAVRPAGEAEPAWSALSELGRRFGFPAEFGSASRAFDEVAARVPAFEGLSHRALDGAGARLKGG
ncbi:MAG: molybdopterin-dependent oxidoreductase, partial [Acidobacteriota bacterium]